MKRITVVGLGYVGMAMAALMSEKHKVCIFDIDQKKIDDFSSGILPFHDPLANDTIKRNADKLTATTDAQAAFANAQIVVLCTPTNYDQGTNYFDTKSLENSIHNAIKFGNNPKILIKSTIPIGFTEKIRKVFGYKDIFFSPEFLREGSGYQDNLTPSRIIVGDMGDTGKLFAELLAESTTNTPPQILMPSNEAEAVKLMSNTYLALRVAFFNEIDTYALSNGHSIQRLLEGICSDPRIGHGYNNPSFGYGGYCLPKDTKQIEAEFGTTPQKIISAIPEANKVRISYLAKKIIDAAGAKTVGIYRIQMKAGSDNFRESSAVQIIDLLRQSGIEVLIYEPLIEDETFRGYKVVNNFNEFVDTSGIIVTNRMDARIDAHSYKVFTRDVFNEN